MDLRVGQNLPVSQPPVQDTVSPGAVAPAQPSRVQTPSASAAPGRPLVQFSANGRRRAELAQFDQAARSAQESVNRLQMDVAALSDDEGSGGLGARVGAVVDAAAAEIERTISVEDPIRARADASDAIASIRQSIDGQAATGGTIQGNVSRQNAARLLGY
ncbi:MAG: hypothetical protein GWP08_10895 [Nitrospiraceae bacterium]|nr:hypothetical protein [Nitrospiraceae bacterium]